MRASSSVLFAQPRGESAIAPTLAAVCPSACCAESSATTASSSSGSASSRRVAKSARSPGFPSNSRSRARVTVPATLVLRAFRIQLLGPRRIRRVVDAVEQRAVAALQRVGNAAFTRGWFDRLQIGRNREARRVALRLERSGPGQGPRQGATPCADWWRQDRRGALARTARPVLRERPDPGAARSRINWQRRSAGSATDVPECSTRGRPSRRRQAPILPPLPQHVQVSARAQRNGASRIGSWPSRRSLPGIRVRAADAS